MNRWIKLKVPFTVTGPSIDDHAFSVLDQLFELSDLTTIRDPDVYVALDEGTVTLELLSSGPTDLDAVRAGLTAMRTAIHAAGGNTHGWENDFGAVTDPTLFPAETPLTEWEATETTFSKALVDA